MLMLKISKCSHRLGRHRQHNVPHALQNRLWTRTSPPPASQCPTQLLDGESLSLKGIPISIKRVQTPDATLGAMTIEIHYGGKGASSHAGRRVWYSDCCG